MSIVLIVSIIAITSALMFYTVGVWSEKLASRLKPWHLVLFWAGFVCDTTGTTLMGDLAGRLQLNLHGVTGALAILLMLGHALWATVVLLKKDENALRTFHSFSLFVWLVWLVPYFTGMAGAILPKA
jgi:uncharacterized repeat protein (TIGR03987 family)